MAGLQTNMSVGRLAGSPVVSVVIPTIGTRNSLLERAVESAVGGWEAGGVEVLVVLNLNLEWADELTGLLQGYANVSVLICPVAGVCAARNFGLSRAKGQLVRFLDDDDYLCESVAVKQSLEMLSSGAELSSYSLEMIDDAGRNLGRRTPIESADPYVALCPSSRLQIPASFVFRRDFISQLRWDESLSLAEDTVWLTEVLSKAEVSWLRSNEVVGVWYQHSLDRLSRRYSSDVSSVAVAQALEVLSVKEWSKTENRKAAIANGLWSCIIAGFKFDPLYWSRMSNRVRQLAPGSCPDLLIYKLLDSIGVSPRVTNWLLLPAYMVIRAYRSWRYGD